MAPPGHVGVAAEKIDRAAGIALRCIVYLACAALGLGTVLRGLVDRRALAQALGLPATQRITLAQSVGVPLA
jgi:hypothetical protein